MWGFTMGKTGTFHDEGLEAFPWAVNQSGPCKQVQIYWQDIHM